MTEFNISEKYSHTNDTLREAVTLWLNNISEANKKYGHISLWNTSKITNMSYLFHSNEGHINKAQNFNEDIGNWDTSNVKNMRFMFSGANFFWHYQVYVNFTFVFQ